MAKFDFVNEPVFGHKKTTLDAERKFFFLQFGVEGLADENFGLCNVLLQAIGTRHNVNKTLAHGGPTLFIFRMFSDRDHLAPIFQGFFLFIEDIPHRLPPLV